MNEKTKQLKFWCDIINLPEISGRAILINVSPENISDYESFFLTVSHKDFLDHLSKHGFVPFPDGDIDHIILKIKKEVFSHDYVQKIIILQEAPTEYGTAGDMSDMYTLCREDKHLCRIHCATNLPFPFYDNAIIVAYSKNQ